MRLLARPIPLFLVTAIATAVLSAVVLAVLAQLESSEADSRAASTVSPTPAPPTPSVTATEEPRLSGADLQAIDISAVELPAGDFARYSLNLASTIDDLERYWTSWFGGQGLDWAPPSVHTRVEFVPELLCSGRMPDVRGSYFCKADNFIALAESDQVLPIYVHVGAHGVATVISHEFGHSVQGALGLEHERSSFEELQADCFAGAWFRDYRDRAALERQAIFSQARGAMSTTDQGEDLAERYASFGLGFDHGPQACIDEFAEEGVRFDFD